MPPFGVISRRNLVKFLKSAGFEGPYSGGKYQFMIKDDITLRIPNPHHSEIGKSLLLRILRQAGISKEKWGKL